MRFEPSTTGGTRPDGGHRRRPLRDDFERIAKRRGRKIAKVAIARRIAGQLRCAGLILLRRTGREDAYSAQSDLRSHVTSKSGTTGRISVSTGQ
jgi:hypothetical protein